MPELQRMHLNLLYASMCFHIPHTVEFEVGFFFYTQQCQSSRHVCRPLRPFVLLCMGLTSPLNNGGINSHRIQMRKHHLSHTVCCPRRSTQVMSWIFLPFFQFYSAAGNFTIAGRWVLHSKQSHHGSELIRAHSLLHLPSSFSTRAGNSQEGTAPCQDGC